MTFVERAKEWALVALLCIGAFMAWNLYQEHKSYQQLGTQYHQLEENVAQAKTTVVGKVSGKLISPVVKAHIKPGSTVEVAGKTGIHQQHVAQSGNAHAKDFKQYQSVEKELYWKNKSGQELPIGVVIYEKNTGHWLARTYGLNISTNTVITKGWDGKYTTTVEADANVPHRKGYEHENYKLDINNAEFEIKQPSDMVWSFWNPTLSLGYAEAINPITRTFGLDPMIKFNFINYGYEKSLPVYSFLSPVLLFDNNGHGIDVGLEAAAINIGQYVPLIKNLHLGVGYSFKGSVFISLSAVF